MHISTFKNQTGNRFILRKCYRIITIPLYSIDTFINYNRRILLCV
ncbi:hypothetical protein CLOL250_01937 [Clostridium sp. L2-50]|nr:hypothetical protein CLOL250_01937 [Clostridium sp. L2-50]